MINLELQCISGLKNAALTVLSQERNTKGELELISPCDEDTQYHSRQNGASPSGWPDNNGN